MTARRIDQSQAEETNSVCDAQQTPDWLLVVGWLAAAAALLHAGWVLATWLHTPLLDQHAFRQTQTALSAFWLLHGGPFLAYETPVLGAPWAIPFELPVYQALAAALAAAGIPFDAAGRLVSFAFLLSTAWPLHMLTRDLALPRIVFPFACALLLGSPLYTFWGRSFLIETCAWFFGWLWLALFLRCLRTGGFLVTLGAVLAGLLAVTAKATTFPAFALLGGLLALPRGWRWLRSGMPMQELLPLALLAAALLLPFAGGLIWVAYSDTVKAANPIGRLLTSSALGGWNYGSMAQRLGQQLWGGIVINRVLPDLFGTAAPLALVLLAAAFARRRDAMLMLGATLGFLLPFLLFTNLHIVHNYYQVANGGFLIAAVAIGLASLAGSRRAPVLAAVALAWILGGQIAHFHRVQRSWLQQDPRAIPTYVVAEAARGIVPRDGALIVLGDDWSSTVPYYAERRSLALPNWTPLPLLEAALRDPQRQLGGARFAGVVHCAQPGPGYGAGEAIVAAFVAGRAVLFEYANCRLLAATR